MFFFVSFFVFFWDHWHCPTVYWLYLSIFFILRIFSGKFLNLFRSDRLCLPSDFKNFELLQIEATFYDIPGLISEVERHRHKSGRIETTKREYSESHYILMEVSRTSKAIEISGAKKTIDSIFNINSNLAVGATNCLYYQQLRLSESVKNLAPAEAVDKILGTGAFKIFKVSTITIENEPTTSYHFVVQ